MQVGRGILSDSGVVRLLSQTRVGDKWHERYCTETLQSHQTHAENGKCAAMRDRTIYHTSNLSGLSAISSLSERARLSFPHCHCVRKRHGGCRSLSYLSRHPTAIPVVSQNKGRAYHPKWCCPVCHIRCHALLHGMAGQLDGAIKAVYRAAFWLRELRAMF